MAFNWEKFEEWRLENGIKAKKIAEVSGISSVEYYRKRRTGADLSASMLQMIKTRYNIDQETLDSFFMPCESSDT